MFAFFYHLAESRWFCDESNGCLTCVILNEVSAENYDEASDAVISKQKLGLATQTLESSCSKVVFPATRENIEDYLMLSSDDWDTLEEDMVQMNLFFLENNCDDTYFFDCYRPTWKLCDEGLADDAFIFNSDFTFQDADNKVTSTTQVLRDIIQTIRSRANVKFKFDDDDHLSGINVPKDKTLHNYMMKDLGYTDIRERHEWPHLKETLLMVCELRALWIFSARVYVAAKLGAFVTNNCQQHHDDRRISDRVLKQVATNYDVSERNLWEEYFSPLIRYDLMPGVTLDRVQTNCENSNVLTKFTPAAFLEDVDSSTTTYEKAEESSCEKANATYDYDWNSAGSNADVPEDPIWSNDRLFQGVRTPGNYCSVLLPFLEIKPFSVAMLYQDRNDEGTSDCFTYTGKHLTFSPYVRCRSSCHHLVFHRHFLAENPCGYSQETSPFEFSLYGKHGSSEANGIFTYIGIELNTMTEINYVYSEDGLNDCRVYTEYNRTELRAVKNERQSCTPFSIYYTEGDDTVTQFNSAGESYNVQTLEEYDTSSGAMEPPNLNFESEAEICGPYQQLSSDPDVSSGFYKICTRNQPVDQIAASWAFAGLCITGTGIVLAIFFKCIFHDTPMDETIVSSIKKLDKDVNNYEEQYAEQVEL